MPYDNCYRWNEMLSKFGTRVITDQRIWKIMDFVKGKVDLWVNKRRQKTSWWGATF